MLRCFVHGVIEVLLTYLAWESRRDRGVGTHEKGHETETAALPVCAEPLSIFQPVSREGAEAVCTYESFRRGRFGREERSGVIERASGVVLRIQKGSTMPKRG